MILGNKVTLEYMESRILDQDFHKWTNTMTLCTIVMDNGYVVIGKSACVDPANYNQQIGEKLAREDAIKQLWPLFGFLLAEQIKYHNEQLALDAGG